MPAMIRLENLSFSYPLGKGNLPVFSEVNANFERGAVTAVVGRSGCGKTSLLRLMARLSAPSSGRLFIDGEANGAIRAKTAVIFQDYGLLPWASVRANAELGLKIKGLAAGERRARVDKVLEELGLAPFAALYPARLSGGMRQRVAIARAFVSDSDLLLLDEPFSSLDAITRETVQDSLLSAQRRYGATIVLVTHSIEEAAYLADAVYIMEGKNPSRLSEPFATGRRAAKAQEGAARASEGAAPAQPSAQPAGVPEQSPGAQESPPCLDSGLSARQPRATGAARAADTPRAAHAAANAYREDERYFEDIAALRSRFAESADAPPETESEMGAAARGGGAIGLKGFGAKVGKIALATIFAALLWEFLARAFGRPFLPPPGIAAARFAERFADGTLAAHTLASLGRVFLALAIASPAAWGLGLVSGRSRAADALASPLVYLLHPLPKVAFLPLLMLFLGLGDASKIALMGLVIFGQLFVGARDATKAISPALLDTVRSLGFGRVGILRRAIFPATLPALFSSLRISLGTTIAVLFLSETFASMNGLGWYIMDAWSRIDYPDMYAAIMALSATGLALYLILDAIEAFALRWRDTA